MDIYKRRVSKFRRDVDRVDTKDTKPAKTVDSGHRLNPKIFYQSKMKDLEANEKYIRGCMGANQLNIIAKSDCYAAKELALKQEKAT